jgi:hypothetical protein
MAFSNLDPGSEEYVRRCEARDIIPDSGYCLGCSGIITFRMQDWKRGKNGGYLHRACEEK